MFKKLLPWYLLALVVLSLAFIYGCGSAPTSGGGGGGGGISGRQYYGINSMGGTNKCTINDTAFSLHFESGTMEGLTISGNVTTLESGLVSCEITSSSDPAKISTGEILYAYEVSNEVLVIGAGPDNGQVILILPALSNTAPSACSFEGITIARTDWLDPQNQDVCMTAELSGSGPYTIQGYNYDEEGGAAGSGTISGWHFTGGRLCTADADADTAPQFFFSPKGMVAMSGNREGSGWRDGEMVGAIYDSTVSTLELATDKCYIGMSFARDLDSNNTYVEAITVESTGVETLTVSSMEVSSGAALGVRGTITLGAMGDPGQGIIDATINSEGTDYQAKMVAYKYQNTPDKYAVCGFVSIETNAMSFFAIEQ